MTGIVFERLLSLVNSALWNKLIDERLFVQMDDKEWDKLFHFAVRHGVIAIAYDGIRRLPFPLQPPLKLRMTWALSTDQIEQKYKQISYAAKEMHSLFKKEGIDMLIFKGLDLSTYYPNAAHREFGDIDIYLFGKHKEGDLLLDKNAIKKRGSSHYKHSNYYYKNIMIENHFYLLCVKDSERIAILNEILLTILQNREAKQKIQEDNELLFPPISFTALFFIIHAIKHLSTSPLQLRTYCDWALFLQAHVHQLDMEEWKHILSQSGLLDIAEAITTLTFKWMKSSVSLPFTVESHPEIEERISEEMLRPFYTLCQSNAAWKVFIYKLKRLLSICKRHVSFYGGNLYKYFFSRFYSSFIDHIKNPETIFKNQ